MRGWGANRTQWQQYWQRARRFGRVLFAPPRGKSQLSDARKRSAGSSPASGSKLGQAADLVSIRLMCSGLRMLMLPSSCSTSMRRSILVTMQWSAVGTEMRPPLDMTISKGEKTGVEGRATSSATMVVIGSDMGTMLFASVLSSTSTPVQSWTPLGRPVGPSMGAMIVVRGGAGETIE